LQTPKLRWQDSMDGLGVVAWTARARTWTVTSIGRNVESVFGYPRRAWRTKGFWLAHVDATDRDLVGEFLEEALGRRGDVPETCEYRFVDATGIVRWVRTSVAPATMRAGAVSGLHLDITGGRTARAALGAKDEQYQFALEVAGVRIWETGSLADAGIVPAPIAALAGLGSVTPVRFDEWLQRVHPRDRERVLAHATQAGVAFPADEGGARSLSRLEYRVRHVDGSIRWLETTVAKAHGIDDATPSLFGTVADVTDRVRERAARRTAERLHRDVWESIPSSAAVLDRSGVIVEVNPAWEAITQASDGPGNAFVGENYLGVARAAASRGEQAAARAADGIAGVLAGTVRQFVFDYTCSIAGFDGERWMRMRVLPLHRPARGAIIMHDDITDRMTAEWAAQRRRDDLTHMQRLATLGELATSIAHELNQPLAAIMASASTARRILRDQGDLEMLKPIIGDVLEAAARAADVVRRARAMVRHDDAILETVSMNDIVSGVARLMASDLVIRQVSLRLDLDPDVRAVVGDRIQLQQVLLNLLLNAVDALDELPRERRNVIVTTRQIGDGDVELRVRDTGDGIPPGMGNRVFEPFVTTKRKGTGLGLAIVRAIVHAHGGHVLAETPTDGGASFRVILSAH
jgi:C4-dicarboxylate-specific signal transduction histidine kinase